MTDARSLIPQNDKPVGPVAGSRPAPRAPYQRPALEKLGTWSARTLQMTIPVEPF